MIATMFIELHYPVRKVLQYAGLSASSFYYQASGEAAQPRGIKPSEYTLLENGAKVANHQVAAQVKSLLEKEFVDYGYLKVTYYPI